MWTPSLLMNLQDLYNPIESDLPKTNKSKSMALKSVDDGGFDYEISSTKIAYIAKNFRDFLRNNNRKAKNWNNADTKNVKNNETTKNNNSEKSKDKVVQSSNNSLGQQYFVCQGYGHLKSECPTYLRSKGNALAVTLSDDEVSNYKFESNQEQNFMTFTATVKVSEPEIVEENPSDGELFENVNLQKACNKLCKIATQDAMNVDIGLKKINTLEQEKKILLVKLLMLMNL